MERKFKSNLREPEMKEAKSEKSVFKESETKKSDLREADFEVIPIPVYYLFHNEFNNEQYNTFMFLFQTKILWFSYRKDFQPITKPAKQLTTHHPLLDLIPKSSVYTSDVGWGCMLRCTQMLLAQALLKMNRYDVKDIIKLFLDKQDYPFSIHSMVKEGLKFGKNPGDWYGPQMACHLIKNCYSNYQNKLQKRSIGSQEDQLKIIIAEQGVLYEEDYIDEYLEKLVLIPVRLGLRKVDSKYYSDIRYFLKHYGSVGILGGSPRHALYFVGSVKTPEGKETNKLIALDPHTNQDIDFNDLTTYHCKEPTIIHMNDIDPNIAFGFYFRHREDFISLKTMIDCNKSDLIAIQKSRKETDINELLEDFEIL